MVSHALLAPATPDVMAVLQDYAEGLYHGDVERLREVFHPQLRLFGHVQGQGYEKGLEDYLAVVAARPSPASLGEALRTQVLALEVRGSIACARLSVPMLGFHYLDYLSLCRQGARWQITGKLFTHLDPHIPA